MKLLHTSDWHLGRRIHGVDVRERHAAFIDWLTGLVTSRGIDAVLVSGDVYDRAIPAPDALSLWDRAVSGLVERGVRVIATSGNHDSFVRLGVGRRQLEAAGVHLRTHLSDIARPVRLGYEGSLLAADSAAPGVSVHGIPYLEPALTWERMGARSRSHAGVLGRAMEQILTRRDRQAAGDRLVVLAHAFVAGSVSSDSERDVSVGGVGIAPVSVFEPCDYAALGHVHRPQDLRPEVRYSGSPLPFSFGEERQAKRVVEIEFASRDSAPVMTSHEVPELVRLRTLSGTLAQVLEAAGDHQESLVSAELTDPVRVPGALDELRRAFPGFIRMAWTRLAAAPAAAAAQNAAAAAGRSDSQVFEEFYARQRGGPAPPHALRRFESALSAVMSQAEVRSPAEGRA